MTAALDQAPRSAPALDVASPQAPPPARLDGDPFVQLAVARFGDVVVSAPIGTTRRRPIVVAVHGNNDRPEWQCRTWRRIVGARAFVVCPRGTSRDAAKTGDAARFTYASPGALESEIEADVAAVVAAYGPWVDADARIYSGHSLGAIYGASIVQRAPARWSRIVVSEGGLEGWTTWGAQLLANHGPHRLLFACGQASCFADAKAAATRTGRLVPTQIAYGRGGGHHFFGAVADAIDEAFAWLIDGDPRFDVD